MISCYDCIHCGACSDAGDSGFSSLKEDASECVHYKNKEDVEEVVKCKDCKYRGELDCPMYHEELEDCDDGDYIYTDMVAVDNTEDDGFCYCGERIESEVEK